MQPGKRWISIVAIALLSLSAMIMGGTSLIEKKIKQLAIEKINEQVRVPILVKGHIDLSLFRHFPYASLSFHKVEIADQLRENKKLLQLEELSLLMNVWTLWSEKIEVTKVFASNGLVSIYINNAGIANFDIFKDSEVAADNKFNIALRQAIVEKINFEYLNQQKNEDIRALLNRMVLSGNFANARFDLRTQADAQIILLATNNERYLEQKKITADMTLQIDKQQQRYSVQHASLEVEKNEFIINGQWIATANKTQVDFTAESKGDDVAKLIALIPLQFKEKLNGTEGNGRYTISATIKGVIAKGVNPEVLVRASLSDANIRLPKVSKPIEKVNAHGFYRLKSNNDDEFAVEQFQSMFRGEPFAFNLHLQHLHAPSFIFNANGTIDIEEARSFFSDTILENAEGKIDFKKIHLEGNKADWENLLQTHLIGSGELIARAVEFQTGGITYGNINGLLAFENEAMQARGLTLHLLGTDFLFSGRASNVMGYALGLAKKRSDNTTLQVDGKLQMKVLNLGQLISSFDKHKKKSDDAKTDVRMVFNMAGKLQLEAGKLLYNKMQFSDVIADIELSPAHIDLHSLNTRTMGGQLTTHGAIDFNAQRKMEMLLNLKIDALEIPQLFAQCENFGQNTLTAKNLKGEINALAQLKTVWDNYKSIDLNKVEGQLQCSIHQGELLNFEPIKAASKFIKLEELNRITFAELSNTLYIKNRIISIPQMEVNSSALNLQLNGTHTLDNVIDYHLKINLKKLLASKFSRKNNVVQYIEEDPYEGTNVFLTLSGPISNPQIKYDKKAVKNKIKQEFREEREELKSLFKKGEYKQKNDRERTREDKFFDTREEPKFLELEDEKE